MILKKKKKINILILQELNFIETVPVIIILVGGNLF